MSSRRALAELKRIDGACAICWRDGGGGLRRTGSVSALAFTILAVLLVGPTPALVARSEWPLRAPRAAMVLWQAVALAAVLSALQRRPRDRQPRSHARSRRAADGQHPRR